MQNHQCQCFFLFFSSVTIGGLHSNLQFIFIISHFQHQDYRRRFPSVPPPAQVPPTTRTTTSTSASPSMTSLPSPMTTSSSSPSTRSERRDTLLSLGSHTPGKNWWSVCPSVCLLLMDTHAAKKTINLSLKCLSVRLIDIYTWLNWLLCLSVFIFLMKPVARVCL